MVVFSLGESEQLDPSISHQIKFQPLFGTLKVPSQSTGMVTNFSSMSTEKFRRQLRQESQTWLQEGLIDTRFHQLLTERYQFNELEGDANNRFLSILIGLGGVLLGLGVLTFVAANWQGWSRLLRVLLVFSLFVGVNVSGFYLWRSPKRIVRRYGFGLLLLGGVVLGANLGLLSQMYHQSGSIAHLFGFWGLGVLGMSYGLRLPSLGIFGLILVNLAYWSSQPWSSISDESFTGWFIHGLPLLIATGLLPLVYWCRSSTVFGLIAITFVTTFLTTPRPVHPWLTIAITLPPALLWVYSFHPHWRGWFRKSSHPMADPYQEIARWVTIWFICLLYYGFSFHWVWASNGVSNPVLTESISPAFGVWSWFNVFICFLFTLLGWVSLGFKHLTSRQLPVQFINSGLILGCLITTATISVWHTTINPLPVLAPLAFNVLLALMAIALVRDGLLFSERPRFWGGMVLLIMSILSRMVEYNTDLILKSIVFILCGLGMMAAGWWFEQTLIKTKPKSVS